MLLPEGEFLERRWSHSVEALVPGCRDLGRFDTSFHTAAGYSNPCVPRRSWAIIRRRTVLLSLAANRVVPTVCIQVAM